MQRSRLPTTVVRWCVFRSVDSFWRGTSLPHRLDGHLDTAAAVTWLDRSRQRRSTRLEDTSAGAALGVGGGLARHGGFSAMMSRIFFFGQVGLRPEGRRACGAHETRTCPARCAPGNPQDRPCRLAAGYCCLKRAAAAFHKVVAAAQTGCTRGIAACTSHVRDRGQRHREHRRLHPPGQRRRSARNAINVKPMHTPITSLDRHVNDIYVSSSGTSAAHSCAT